MMGIDLPQENAGSTSPDERRTPRNTEYSVEEAAEIISRVHRYLNNMEDAHLKRKWYIGHILMHTDHTRGLRVRTVTAISSLLRGRYHIRAGRTTLLECEKLNVVFESDFARFERWLQDRRSITNRPVYWKDVQRVCLRGPSIPGVVSLLPLDAIAPSPRSEAYLGFVRGHDCVVCGRTAVPHRILGSNEAGSTPSDFSAIPLCTLHQAELRRRGRESFQDRHRVNLFDVAFNLLHRHLTGEWVSMWL